MHYDKYQIKLLNKDLLKIFPEAKDIIPLKIKDYQDKIRKKEKEINQKLKRLYSLKLDEFSEWFGEKAIEMLEVPELNKLEKNLFRLKHLEYLLNPKKVSSSWAKFGEKIEIAKKYPIEEIARSKLDIRQIGQNFICLCPFHNEKTPSFYIYPNTNRFYCFGCQEKGDVINLTMALYDLYFKEVIEMLQY